MKNIMKRLTVLVMLVAVLAGTLCVPTFAGTLDHVPENINDAKKYASEHMDEAWVKRMITDKSDESNTEGGKKAETIEIGGKVYTFKDGYNEESFLTEAKYQYKAANTVNKVSNMTDDLGVNANTDEATHTLKGLVPVINIFLGIVVVLITLLLAVFTAFDVCYITFPVFRNKCEEQKQSGEGALVKTSKNGSAKLRWVSDEAQSVVENNSVESGGNPLTKYLGKRVVAYICVTVVLFILLTGNINIITNLALKVVSFVMDTLNGLGV